MNDTEKQALDLVSLTVVGATLIKWLPALAAIFSIVWTCIRIYETATFQLFCTNTRKLASRIISFLSRRERR